MVHATSTHYKTDKKQFEIEVMDSGEANYSFVFSRNNNNFHSEPTGWYSALLRKQQCDNI